MTKGENTRIGETYESGPQEAGPAKDSLDDTSPIKPSADLELVTRGNAFWADSRPEAANPPAKLDSKDKPESREDTEKQKAPSAKDVKSARVQAALFERGPSSNHAPSLAELAKQRREELGAALSRGKSPKVDPSDEADKDPDDTDPEGLKTQAEKPARAKASAESAVAVVSRSLDIAFIDGHNLYIPGATWVSGENLVIQGKTYQLKRKTAKYPISPQLAAYAGGGFLAGCLLVWMLAAGGSTVRGNIFGMVRDSGTGKLLPGVTVAIEDVGQTSESDPTGMFSFEELPEGVYTLIATDPIYGKQRRSVTVAKGAATVMLDLQREASSIVEAPKQVVKPKAAPTTTETAAEPANTSSRGELAVTASVANCKIFIDGKMLGMGNTVFSGIRAGERTIRVEHEGFTPWVQVVDVKGGELTRIEPKLLAAEPAEPAKLTPEQYAAAGRKLLEQRQYTGAIEQLTLAIKGAQRAQFFAWRADAYAGVKKLQAAESDYVAAYELFKETGDQGKLDGMLERAVLVVPTSAPLRMAYGDYFYSQRKLQDAVKNYRKALEFGSDPTKTNIAIGLAQYAGGSFEEANNSWTLADEVSAGVNPHVAGYLALSSARLQYRTSCRNAVRRLRDYPDVLAQFRSHPDWDRVKHLAGEG